MILPRDEALKRFQELDAYAAKCLDDSKDQITQAILALDTIRSEGLYLQGGYQDWKSYLKDFMDQNGVSRSLAYDNLAVARLASRAGITQEEVQGFGIYPLKPFFEKGGPVLEYDRNTGEILQIAEPVADELPDGEDLSLRYGEWVRENIDEGDPSSVVRSNVKSKIGGLAYSFVPYYESGSWTGMFWSREEGENYKEGYLWFRPNQQEMPTDVKEEMFRLLKVPKDFYG